MYIWEYMDRIDRIKRMERLYDEVSGRQYSRQRYEDMISELFRRVPSVQDVPFKDAYKPGLERIGEFCRRLGNPQESFRAVHVAGTNGKGSVSTLLASSLAASGYRTGLFTSPHIKDFRERMRIAGSPGGAVVAGSKLVSRRYVYSFLNRYRADIEDLKLSFFEISTALAFKWFADKKVDAAVMEVGLGGRLDSTNILHPVLSVITSIGLDHCDLLGNTLGAIAGEKAGIIKPGVPVVIGEALKETLPVFEAAAARAGAMLIRADKAGPVLKGRLLDEGDIAEYQLLNIRTAECAIAALAPVFPALSQDSLTGTGIWEHFRRMGFRGRWETISASPRIIADIGHNPPALMHNFRQLGQLLSEGEYDRLIIVYAVMADKALGDIIPLMPAGAEYIFTTPHTRRAMLSDDILRRFRDAGRRENAMAMDPVKKAVRKAVSMARRYKAEGLAPLIYVGGSTFAVAEAVE